MIESSLNILIKVRRTTNKSGLCTVSHPSLYLEMEVAEGTTLLQALQQSGWLQQYPDLQQWCDEHAQDEQINNKTGRWAYSRRRSY